MQGRDFRLGQLQAAVFNNRQYAGELWRDELVDFCRANPVVTGSSGPVDVSEACPILADWNVRDDLDSDGAILFRRFATRVLNANTDPYDTPFSVSDPVNTPRGLNTDNPEVRQAFADSVKELRDQDIPLDAPLRGWQYETRKDRRIPIHGGPGGLGVFNAINVSFSSGQGYPDVPHGSSFVQTVELGGDCPRTRTILTYSLSTNPKSPHFGDQTRLFSKKRWVKMAFCQADIAADPNLEVTKLDVPREGDGDDEEQAGSNLPEVDLPGAEETPPP
jgi:acyl-homoserine-lactone acylase